MSLIKMKVLIVLTLLSVALAMPYDMVEDEDGQAYYLVPHQRERRQTSVGVSKNGPGFRATVGHQGTIVNNNNHRLDGGAFASKNFRPSGPTTLGGSLDYSHKPSGSGLSVGAANTRRFGTDVNAQGNLNLYNANRGNTRLDAVGQYNRHFGGMGGTRSPNYYGGLEFKHRF